MNHLPILPVIVPALTAVFLLLGARMAVATQRAVSVLAVLGLAGVSAALVLESSSGTLLTYQLGDWAAPFGIVLVVDRLAALMVALTTVVGLGAVLFRGLAAGADADDGDIDAFHEQSPACFDSVRK